MLGPLLPLRELVACSACLTLSPSVPNPSQEVPRHGDHVCRVIELPLYSFDFLLGAGLVGQNGIK